MYKCDYCGLNSNCPDAYVSDSATMEGCSRYIPLALSISPGNKKMGAIASVSLPAGTTCNPDAPCYKACYARRLEARRKSVHNAYERNWHLWKFSPEIYKMQCQAAAATQRFFRYHVSGDIPDIDYLRMMVEVARELPLTNFMAFTKQYGLVNEWIAEHGPLPQNLQILFSVWRNFDCPNPYNLPEAHVAYRDGYHTARPDAFHCHKNCTECCLMGEGCWNLKCGEQVEIPEH